MDPFTLRLSRTEHTLLTELLQSQYQELRQEIVHTDGSRYKLLLKERERTLANLLARLKEEGGMA
jgi:hypothetical protein